MDAGRMDSAGRSNTSISRLVGMLSTGYFLVLMLGCCGFYALLFTGSFTSSDRPSDPRLHKPIDSRIVGKWSFDGKLDLDRWEEYSSRSISFTAANNCHCVASGVYKQDLDGSWKAGDRANKQFTGMYYFLDSGEVEFVLDNGTVFKSRVDFVSKDEMILATTSKAGDWSKLVSGTLKRTKGE